MARGDIRDLTKDLKASKLGFVPRGDHSLEDLYSLVKAKYPALCDDSFLCADNCTNGSRQPEWKHAVRAVLSRLKGTGVVQKVSGMKGWRFPEAPN
jgi:hypothetical protein